ncbi:Sge1 [Fusarium beomiforme]|uniref:Sge1 n=1 Tax=Fusarium beomiforme TaxID=44412 RepID=A0A9P5ACS3_9HYPO|nr:Sge1 [Fusarium beomiforme]
MSGTMPLQPTYCGFIGDTTDALIIFEACLSGKLAHVPRRPHDRERQDLIKSGNIFVYEEHASGIKRWTDSISWSPSRILGNYLLYRELEKPFPPGEKKRARGRNGKTSQQSGGITKSRPRNTVPYQTGLEHGMDYPAQVEDDERALVGSLVDSYDFKDKGLVKKTISITFNGVPHHLVSYYTVEDVKLGKLRSPMEDPRLSNVIPRSELITGQNFRAPIEELQQVHGIQMNGHYGLEGISPYSQQHQPQAQYQPQAPYQPQYQTQYHPQYPAQHQPQPQSQPQLQPQPQLQLQHQPQRQPQPQPQHNMSQQWSWGAYPMYN